MKTTTFLLLILAVAFIGISTMAHADEKPANCSVLLGGLYSPSLSHDAENFNGGSTIHLESKAGFAG